MPRRPPLLPMLALLAALPAGTAAAQDASGCAKFKWPVDRERSAFGTPGLQVVEPGKPLPGIMDPAIVKLKPVADAGFERPPGRKPKGGTFGAAFRTPPVAVAGTYQITLSDEAWIDVIQDGRELRSSASSGQRDCPNVRKSVRFVLAAGQATVQISGAAADSIKVDFLPPP
ncbi:hypothetical protein [Lichenibacterium ramalinae]|uniref:Homogentisate 1,2-dioxygenase n=1 Tax=Lichenibacterium ramalinae TaxID=2316527 RepID=A0A4Q2RCX6_9HYPH|nr:hypothetical protein [Lichenibacterium ramalinae]RYB05038.1 hypothetical protein D3272_11305 [Lichenibacterium ramalinae]